MARAIAACYGEIAATPPGKEELLNEQTSIDLGQNPERARMFRELLIKDIDDELRLLHVALECDDRNDLGLVAHTLKGLCGHLENQQSSNLATWLQQNALSAEPKQLRRMVEQLCQCNTYNEEENQ